MQGVQQEWKAALREVDELQRVRSTHLKQLQFLNDTRSDLEQQINTLNTDYTLLKNGVWTSD